MLAKIAIFGSVVVILLCSLSIGFTLVKGIDTTNSNIGLIALNLVYNIVLIALNLYNVLFNIQMLKKKEEN